MYTVVKPFRDKYTGKIILPGSTFICDENDRIKDLINRGLIKKTILEDGGYKDYLQKYPATHEYLSSFTKKELQTMLEDKGIEYSSRQTKNELIELLQGGE